jgi:hypothetical protein
VTALLFWLRYLARVLANIVTPFRVGARDRLCHYEIERPWTPEESLREFVDAAIVEQRLENDAGEIRSFLDFWLPRQALSGVKKVLIEYSFTTNAPGYGMMLYGNLGTESEAFAEFCARIGIYNRNAELCLAIVNTFSASTLCMIRAEFKPGGATRYSIAGSWYFDVFRGRSGFAEAMARLPVDAPASELAGGVNAISAMLDQDFYPLFFGLSFLSAGPIEAKMYWVRFDPKESPMRPGSTLWRLVEGLGLSGLEMERVKHCNDLLWSNSCDGMTQVAVEFSEGQTHANRVNLIYCGTKLQAVRTMMEELGLAETGLESVAQFEKTMKTEVAKFVAIRVGPEGISSRVKLYGHALFDTRGWGGGDTSR